MHFLENLFFKRLLKTLLLKRRNFCYHTFEPLRNAHDFVKSFRIHNDFSFEKVFLIFKPLYSDIMYRDTNII